MAAFFAFVAVYTFSLGQQRGAIEESAAEDTPTLNPLTSKKLRDELIALVQANALGNFDEEISLLSKRAPLDELPYEIELTKALSLGDAVAADMFANHALARQPRSLSARLYGLSRAAQNGQFERVIEDYERLIELRALDRNILSDALVGVFRENGDWSALLAYLKTNPSTGRALLQRLMNESVDAADLQSLIALYPEQQSSYLDRLVRDGAYDQAYSAWQAFSGLSDEALQEFPFNGEFGDGLAPPPFNWSISGDRAEFQSRGGLYVTFLGTGRPLIARQVMAAPPGDYLLHTEAQGRMPEEGGSLEWVMTCLGSNVRIATSNIALSTIGEREQFEDTLSIPEANCAFQRLELWGRSGAFPKTSRTEVLSVSLKKFSD